MNNFDKHFHNLIEHRKNEPDYSFSRPVEVYIKYINEKGQVKFESRNYKDGQSLNPGHILSLVRNINDKNIAPLHTRKFDFYFGLEEFDDDTA